MKNFKRNIISLGAMLAIGAPIVAVVSCGETTATTNSQLKSSTLLASETLKGNNALGSKATQSIDNSAALKRDLNDCMNTTAIPKTFNVQWIVSSWGVDSVYKASQTNKTISYIVNMHYQDVNSGKSLHTSSLIKMDSKLTTDPSVGYKLFIDNSAYTMINKLLLDSPSMQTKIQQGVEKSIIDKFAIYFSAMPTNPDNVMYNGIALLDTSFHLSGLTVDKTGHMEVKFDYKALVAIKADSAYSPTQNAKYMEIKYGVISDSNAPHSAEMYYHANISHWSAVASGEVDWGHIYTDGTWRIEKNISYNWTSTANGTATNGFETSGTDYDAYIGNAYYNNSFTWGSRMNVLDVPHGNFKCELFNANPL